MALGAFALLGACRPSPPQSRVSTLAEASPERVVVNYPPRHLRILPTGTGVGGYLLLGSERPGLPAVFRPLGVSSRKAPAQVFARAGELAWVVNHVVEAPPPDAAQPLLQTTLLSYDTDNKVATPQKIALPAPCMQTRPALLHSDGRELYVLLRCSPQEAAIVLRLSAKSEVLSARVVPGAGDAELFLHHGQVDYLLADQKVFRVDESGVKSSPVLFGPGGSGGADARDLVYVGSTVVAVDGASGRVSGVDAEQLEPRFERRFYTSSAQPVTRLRAVVSGPDRLTIVVAERDGSAQGDTRLVAMALVLAPVGKNPGFPTRIILGSGPQKSDHELCPIADSDGGGALLMRTHAGNTGPLVALTQLHL